MSFTIHTKENAPEDSRALLAAEEKAFGFNLNFYGILAESPASLKAFVAAYDALKGSELSAVEQEVISIAVSVKNECSYCVSMHSTVSEMIKMPVSILEDLRDEEKLSDRKLEALQKFTLLIMKNEGWVSEVDVNLFLKAGYTKGHVIDVILFIGFVSLSNYICHITEAPIDEPFSNKKWSTGRKNPS